MLNFKKLLGGAALLSAISLVAYAGGVYTNGLTLATAPLTGNEQAAFDTTLGQGLNPQSEAISVQQLQHYAQPPVALTDGATIVTDAGTSSLYTVTLAGNRTLANPTNLVSGQSIRYEITQDGTGSRTLAFGTLFTFSGSSTISTTASYVDMITCTYDGTKLRCTLAVHFA